MLMLSYAAIYLFINICLSVGEMKYHGIGGEYLRPRTINRYRIIKNKEQFFKRPSRTQGLLNGKKNIDKNGNT